MLPSLSCLLATVPFLMCLPSIRFLAAAGPPSATTRARSAMTVGSQRCRCVRMSHRAPTPATPAWPGWGIVPPLRARASSPERELEPALGAVRHRDGDAPVLLVEVTGGIVAVDVARRRACGHVEHALTDSRVEHQRPGELGAAA